jgi:hypothetical protein
VQQRAQASSYQQQAQTLAAQLATLHDDHVRDVQKVDHELRLAKEKAQAQIQSQQEKAQAQVKSLNEQVRQLSLDLHVAREDAKKVKKQKPVKTGEKEKDKQLVAELRQKEQTLVNKNEEMVQQFGVMKNEWEQYRELQQKIVATYERQVHSLKERLLEVRWSDKNTK